MEDAARAFKISGYNYQKSKEELLKFKNMDPIEIVKKEKILKSKPERGVRAYFITTYDPRVPHPRQLLSRNYHHIQSNPELANLFPRKNLVGGTRRLKNLQEMLLPTVQAERPPGDDDDDRDAGRGPGNRVNGSYYCKRHKERSNCDVCSYMIETSFVTSYYFNRRFAIHLKNIHLPAGMKKKMVWFVYLVHDTSCQLLHVGSTSDVCARWSQTKKACQDSNRDNTTLYKHFQDGCPKHQETGNIRHLNFTLLDHIQTSEERLTDAGHQGGAGCRCGECQRLKDCEDKWIMRLGSFHAPHGLNTRNEIITRSRVNFRS